MPKYTVKEVVDIIKGLSNEEKSELKAQLPEALEETDENGQKSNEGQSVSQSFGDVQVDMGGESSNFGISNVQNQAGDESETAVATGQSEATASKEESLEEALEIIQMLKREVGESEEIDESDKREAQGNLERVEAEIQKPEPNREQVESTLDRLKQKLEKVGSFASPIINLSSLIAKVIAI